MGVFGSIVNGLGTAAAYGLAPVTGGASLLGTKSGRDFVNNKFLGGDQARAARNAAGVQTSAATQANNVAGSQLGTDQGYQAPFYNGGAQTFQQMNNRYQQGGFNPGAMGQYQGPGAQGYQLQQFNPGDLTQDPGYKFRMQQGINAVDNGAAARGMLHSGNTMNAENDYAQGMASNEYQNAFARNQAQNQQGMENNNANRNFGYQNFSDIYNTGAGAMAGQFNQGNQLAGYGQQAGQVMGNLGQNYSQQYGQNLMGGANAQAAGIMGAANAQTQGYNNLLNVGSQVLGGIVSMPNGGANMKQYGPQSMGGYPASNFYTGGSNGRTGGGY